MNKRIAIIQSNYIPWKGYFDIINMADEFIFHDDLQYTKNDWRNRNIIKTPFGIKWLTIPCGTSEKRLICDVEMNEFDWQKKHWSLIKQYYQKAKFFKEYYVFFEEIYLNRRWMNLSLLNQYIIKKISDEILLVQTKFYDSRDFNLQQKKGERVLELLKKVGATEYISGPAAKNYLDESQFNKEGIEVKWIDYSGYPEYTQLYPPFAHGVSIIDMIFNLGDKTTNYMKSFQSNDRDAIK